MDGKTGEAGAAFDEKAAFLADAAAYAHAPPSVDAVDTHMARVFLAGELAYKIKKPVRHPFLDFSTLAARELACREEVRLNARLAPGIYLEAVPLTKDRHGALAIGGEGQIVDWLVKMKRLPAGRMLDATIAAGSTAGGEIAAVAAHLVEFYRAATPAQVSAQQICSRFLREHEECADLLKQPQFALDHDLTLAVLRQAANANRSVRSLIEDRISLGMLVEGHGDLRPEHVCLTSPPVIIDCLEFNRELRLLDPYDEIIYLALECERLGAAWIGEQLLGVLSAQLGRRPPARLLAFYRGARALLRAKLALSHLLEPDPRTPQLWEPRARIYIELASASLAAFDARGNLDRR